MKVFSFGCRPYDEMGIFADLADEMAVEVRCTKETLGLHNVHLAEGADYVSVLTSPVTAPILDGLSKMGVKMLGTRTVGYDHIDCAHASEIGLRISNSAYSPDAVAEYTVMLMLMALRNMKRIMERSSINDFTLKGLSGHNLSQRRVGIVGMGSIGLRVIELLRGFGCEICACDPSPENIPGVRIMEQRELFSYCDLISLHAPLRENTRHLINRENLALMPRGTVIVNTARGALVDTEALIDALRDGRLGGCALDVIEGEHELYYYNKKSEVLDNPHMGVLKNMPNAIISPHIAFYTRCSVRDMVANCLRAFILDSRGEENPFRIV